MRVPLSIKRNMPRMTWDPKNLYLLWRHANADRVTFTAAKTSLFQQRWKSKALVRAYHGDFIPEKVFKRWYLPSTLPDVRPRRIVYGDDTAALEQFAQRDDQLAKEKKRQMEIDKKGLAPVGSLMFAEVERRIDVFIFRCCFAHSVYEARRMVIHGNVLLNGRKHRKANTRLAPGDMVSVNPEAIRFLRGEPSYPSELDLQPWRKMPEPVVESSAKADEGAKQEAEQENNTMSPSPDTDFKDERKATRKEEKPLTPFRLPPYASPHIFIPAYIEPSFLTCSAVYVRHPTARPGYSEIPTPFDADGEVVRLAWEWYVKRRPRIRSTKQLARMPENRTFVQPSKRYMASRIYEHGMRPNIPSSAATST